MRNLRLAWAIALAGASALANADIAYNNYGDGDTYDDTGYSIAPEYGIAMNFSSATTGFVSLIKLALGANSRGEIYYYDVSINADDNGLPGQELESWTGATAVADVLSGDGSASLVAGTSYWVVVMSDGDEADVGEWYDGGHVSLFAQQLGSDEWHSRQGAGAAYRVETQAVPEAPSAASLALGAAAVASRVKRKRAPKGA